jgi:hypothetical protein
MTVPRDEHDAQTKVLVEILRHRDALLWAAKDFLNLIDDQDFSALTIEQQAKLQDLAMYAGCTNLSWWGLPKSEMQGGSMIG